MKARHLVLVLLVGFATVEAAAQLPPLPPGAVFADHPNQRAPRKDIPAIARAANGAIVTIVMANNDKPFAQGTGFLVGSDGVIVTNYHVIETGNRAAVKFSDGTILPVDGVLAADKVRDLAIVKVHGKTFRTLTLGNSDRIQVGEEVVAIGNPLGLELTVSNGILSGVRTDKEAGGKFLQTTTPITHGSSGGPLFNMMGEVVGITTLGFEGAGNLNFAIPVNDAKLLLSNRSAKLQNLPNESEPKESPNVPPIPPSGDEGLDSPAYRQYLELLKANDLTVTAGLYACFYDNKDWNNDFTVISVLLFKKQTMFVMEHSFKDGVSDDMVISFEGSVDNYSTKDGIYARLPTTTDAFLRGIDNSHKKDVFRWAAGDIEITEGFGELDPTQVQMSETFKLQHFTGRFVRDGIRRAGSALNGVNLGLRSDSHDTGKCVRIPNSMTPEETYALAGN